MKYKLILISVVFLLVLSLFSLAQGTYGIGCEEDFDCLMALGENFYCDLETFGCESYEDTIPEEGSEDVQVPIELLENEEISSEELSLETEVVPPVSNVQVNQLETDLTQLKAEISTLQAGDNSLQQQLNSINQNLQTISNQLNEIDLVKNELNSVAVGLAGLQQDINETTTGLTTIEEDLEKKSKRNKILLVTFFILLAIAVALTLIYYVNRKKSPHQITQQTINYITGHIKEGRKFPEIKQILLKAGWKEEEIKTAYKQTIKNNYQQYTKKNGTKVKPKKAGFDRNRIIAIIVVSILLIGGVIFLLSGTTGQAVKYQRLVDGDADKIVGKVSYEVECTSPHRLNPTEDGCCLDIDGSGKCDYIENRQAATQLGEGQCNDNLQCEQGKLCINNQCKMLNELYSQQVCEQKCSYYGARIKAIYSSDTKKMIKKSCNSDTSCNDYISETSDSCIKNEEGSFCVSNPLVEVYDLKPKQGSYSFVGALEWKILESPSYCKGEQAMVPIKIIRKSGRDVLSEEIITLKEREVSVTITHPLYQGSSFKLKVDKISKPVGC